MTELVLRASSMEAVRAAAMNGAGGVKLRPEGFTPPGVKGVSRSEAAEIIKYCRIRGMEVYITPGALISDAREADFAAIAGWASSAGASAIVAESPAAGEIFRKVAPELPVHGGFGMDIHSLDGVYAAAELGFERVCLSPMLDKNALRYICERSPIETEIKIQGAGCPAYGAACRLGTFLDERQPGFCAETCRENYGFGMPGRTRPLSMKEISLGAHIPEIAAMAPAALSVDSFSASPEYVALAARYFSRALRERRGLDQVERENLKNAFYSQGSADGLFTGSAAGLGGGLYSPGNIFLAGEPEPPSKAALQTARDTYTRGEIPRVQVRFSATFVPGVPATVSVEDDRGHICIAEGQKPLEGDPALIIEEPAPGEEAFAESAPVEDMPAAHREEAPSPETAEEAPEKMGVIPADEADRADEAAETADRYAEISDAADDISAEAAAESDGSEAGEDMENPAPYTENAAAPGEEPSAPGEEPAPEMAKKPARPRFRQGNNAAARSEITALLYKNRGTPYHCRNAYVRIEGGAKITAAEVEQLQKKALEQLTRQRGALPGRETGELLPLPVWPKSEEKTRLTVSVQKASQLSKGLADMEPALVVVPVFEAAAHPAALEPFIRNPEIQVAVSLPKVIWDSDKAALTAAQDKAYALGIDQAEIENTGHAALARSRGFRLRAGLEMNVRTSRYMEELRLSGYAGALLPVDMEQERVRLISKSVNTEMCVYGRVPLITTQACLMVQRGGTCACGNPFSITGDDGENMPVLRDGISCRSVVYSAKKLWTVKNRPEWEKLGLWGARLCFTTENARECRDITAAYLGRGNYAPPGPTMETYKAYRRPTTKKEKKNGRFR